MLCNTSCKNTDGINESLRYIILYVYSILSDCHVQADRSGPQTYLHCMLSGHALLSPCAVHGGNEDITQRSVQGVQHIQSTAYQNNDQVQYAQLIQGKPLPYVRF